MVKSGNEKKGRESATGFPAHESESKGCQPTSFMAFGSHLIIFSCS